MKSVDPASYFVRVPGEQTGQWPILLSIKVVGPLIFKTEIFQRHKQTKLLLWNLLIHTGISARIVVGGSADMVAKQHCFDVECGGLDGTG